MLKIKERGGRLWIMGTFQGVLVRESTGLPVGFDQQAEAIRREREADILSNRSRGPIVRDGAEEYLRRPEGLGVTATSYCRHFAKSKWGSKHMTKLDLSAIYMEYTSQGKARETVRREIGAVQAMLNWIADLYHVEGDFTIKKPGKGDERLRFMMAEEVAAMAAAAEPWFRPIFIALIYTGMRRSELTTMQWHQVKDDHILVGSRKGRDGKVRWRTIDLHPEAKKIFADLRRQHLMKGYRDQRVFRAPEGGPLNDPTRVNKEWNKTAKAAGVVDCTPHDARRTFASMLLAAGVDVRTIADLLGHARLDLLMLYAQVLGINRAKGVAKMPALGTIEAPPLDGADEVDVDVQEEVA